MASVASSHVRHGQLPACGMTLQDAGCGWGQEAGSSAAAGSGRTQHLSASQRKGLKQQVCRHPPCMCLMLAQLHWHVVKGL